MTFLHYLLATFCSPLYFLLQKRYVAFFVHGFFYVVAIVTFFVFFMGIFVWAFLAGHAMWDLSTCLRKEHIDMQAKAIAAEMRAKQ